MRAARRGVGAAVAAALFAVPLVAAPGAVAGDTERRASALTAPRFDPHAEGLFPIGEGPDHVPFRSKVSARSLLTRAAADAADVTGRVSAVTGDAHVPVALVDFSDVPAEATLHSPAAFDALLFQEGYPHGAGSMRDYYQDQSGGLFDVDGTVSPWTRLSKTLGTYSAGSYGLNQTEPNGRTMARDAAAATDDVFDFCDSDADGDGLVDTFFVIHAGPGAEATSVYDETQDAIWSHQSQLFPRYTTNDTCANGKTMKIGTYVTMPEEVLFDSWGTPGAPSRLTPIGVFVHEFGHALGLPDLYDIDYSSPGGVGTWDAMAAGGYGFDGQTEWRPTPFSAWTKTHLGWALPQTLTASLPAVAIPSADLPVVGAFTGFYKLIPEGSDGKEYFLVENRTPHGWAADFPGSGLLVWHIDDSKASDRNEDNADDAHRRVELIQADGLDDLSDLRSFGLGDLGDMFPGSTNNFSLTDLTSPSTRLHSGALSGVSVTGIGLGGLTTVATLRVPGGPVPNPVPDPTQPAEFFPDDLFVNKGSAVGTIAALEFDDGAGLTVRSAKKRQRYLVDYDLYFTVDPSVDKFEVLVDSFKRTKTVVWIYNWDAEQYETVTTLRRIDPGAPLRFSLEGAAYVSPDGYVDVGFSRKAKRAFAHHLDQVILTTIP